MRMNSICLPRGLQIEFFICIAKLHIGMFIILLCDKKIGGELLMASKAAIAAKEQSVKELAERIKASKLVLLVEFIGTNVADDTVLRKDLREAGALKTVKKNNIIKRALNANGEAGLDEILVGTSAIITSEEDYLAPLKIVYKFSKTHENYKIKGGMIDGKVVSAEDLLVLAQLPSKEELLSKLAGSLLGIITKLAVAVDQVRIKKEEEAE